jgi:hypothetical protein
LRAREALQGGRTETIALYRRINEQLNEFIKYLDVNSLYPYVMKFKSYPVGFPEYITENFNYALYFYFGIMKATLLPPRKLFFPVLPAKVGKKLVFTLCPVCAAEQTKMCLHTEKERLMTGVWVTGEIYLAVTKGVFERKFCCFILLLALILILSIFKVINLLRYTRFITTRHAKHTMLLKRPVEYSPSTLTIH